MEMIVEDMVMVGNDAAVASRKPEPQKWLSCPQRAADIKTLCSM